MDASVLEIIKVVGDVSIPFLVQFGPEILVGAAALVYNRDWLKLKNLAEEKSLELADSIMTNEEKLNAVISAVWLALPKKMKVFPMTMFVNEATIKHLVNMVYVTRVKPQRDVEGSNPSARDLANEITRVSEEVKKANRKRDAQGRFIKEA